MIFDCLNLLHSFRTENKLKSHKKACKNEDFCGIVMPSENDCVLEFNQYVKSDEMPYIMLKLNLKFKKKINKWMWKQPRKIFNNKIR